MPLHISFAEILLRLTLASLAGLLVGLNRERGHATGLRTTMLVCLAAALSMVQMNILLPQVGKTSDSFVVLDLMRLPLGILSGIGFIGAGAILKKGDRVHGVTTAATMWYVTVMGLCFGGGQIVLGLLALALSLIVLIALKWVEKNFLREGQATLVVIDDGTGMSEAQLCDQLEIAGYSVKNISVAHSSVRRQRRTRLKVNWKDRGGSVLPPPLVSELAQRPSSQNVQWLR